jgi:hypothetical protein
VLRNLFTVHLACAYDACSDIYGAYFALTPSFPLRSEKTALCFVCLLLYSWWYESSLRYYVHVNLPVCRLESPKIYPAPMRELGFRNVSELLWLCD